jgi:hypothetical protein
VDDESPASGICDFLDELAQILPGFMTVYTDSVLDGNRQAGCGHHCLHALGDFIRVRHQTGADHVILNPVAGAAHVQVHFIEAVLLGQACALCQLIGVTAPELQCQRVFFRVVPQKPRGVAMNQRPGRHHLGVEQRATAESARQKAVVMGGPVHHRGHAEAAGRTLSGNCC